MQWPYPDADFWRKVNVYDVVALHIYTMCKERLLIDLKPKPLQPHQLLCIDRVDDVYITDVVEDEAIIPYDTCLVLRGNYWTDKKILSVQNRHIAWASIHIATGGKNRKWISQHPEFFKPWWDKCYDRDNLNRTPSEWSSLTSDRLKATIDTEQLVKLVNTAIRRELQNV